MILLSFGLGVEKEQRLREVVRKGSRTYPELVAFSLSFKREESVTGILGPRSCNFVAVTSEWPQAPIVSRMRLCSPDSKECVACSKVSRIALSLNGKLK